MSLSKAAVFSRQRNRLEAISLPLMASLILAVGDFTRNAIPIHARSARR